MDSCVGSITKLEWTTRCHLFKLILILLIVVSLDATIVECSPALSHSSRSQAMAAIEPSNLYPRRYRSIISTLSTLTDDPKLDEDVSASDDTEDDNRDQWLRELSQSADSGQYVHRQEPKPYRVMSKKALSLFAHWKPSHYTSAEDSQLASDVISAVARGHSRPVGGPLRWGRR